MFQLLFSELFRFKTWLGHPLDVEKSCRKFLIGQTIVKVSNIMDGDKCNVEKDAKMVFNVDKFPEEGEDFGIYLPVRKEWLEVESQSV